MDHKSKMELEHMIKLAVDMELEKRDFLTRDEITRISKEACMMTMDHTFQLMGLKFNDRGIPDFETIRANNDFTDALRKGSEQTRRIVWKSCVGTFVVAIITYIGMALNHEIVTFIRGIINATPPKP